MSEDKYLDLIGSQISRIEDRIERFEDKFDKIVDELSQINKTLAMQHVSLDEHIAGVKTLQIIVAQNKEEAERETERLEAEMDKDEARISVIEDNLNFKKEIRKTIKSYTWTTVKSIAIIGYIVGGIMALLGKGTAVVVFFKALLGFN